MAREAFIRELDELKTDLIKMGSMVEESIANTLIAFKEKDIELARRVFNNDEVIDFMEKKIEKHCLILIARQQPLAHDLRTISAALKIITDLERIADHSADIAEITIHMTDSKYIKPLIDIPKMANAAMRMVNKAIDSYVRQDIELAKYVCVSDKEVNELYSKTLTDLITIMKNDAQAVELAVNFIFIAKYLEKMADHATNIAEWVLYNVTGEHKSAHNY